MAPVLNIIDYEVSCAAGTGLNALREALAAQRSGLKPNNLAHSHLETWVGSVPEIDDIDWQALGPSWQSRNNALIHLALNQGTFLQSVSRVRAQVGKSRIGIVMGSSTSSIDRTEAAYRHLQADGHLSPAFRQEQVLNPHAPGLYLAHLLDLKGLNITINTACSSSAKVFASASRWLTMGLVDAVVVGGADTLCLSVLHGFHALQLVSEKPCKPFDRDRDGINLGEGAGFALLTRAGEFSDTQTGISLTGFGESSDAYHMSHPHPEGLGARLAIQGALRMAELSADDIGYINLHGTASKANDHIEGNLVGQMFPNSVASSTKAWMGHTLGAAGILESLIAADALATGLLPGTLNLDKLDDSIAIEMSSKNLSRDDHAAEVSHVMSNSFGFGGSNACLIFSKNATLSPKASTV